MAKDQPRRIPCLTNKSRALVLGLFCQESRQTAEDKVTNGKCPGKRNVVFTKFTTNVRSGLSNENVRDPPACCVPSMRTRTISTVQNLWIPVIFAVVRA